MFVISLFTPPKMTPVGVKSTWEKYGTFLNSFKPKVKRLIQKHEQINDRIGRHKVSVLFNQTYIYIYIYIYICMYVCVCVCRTIDNKVIQVEGEIN